MKALLFPVLADPVMRKELLGVSRHWASYLFRALYVSILVFVVWIIWTQETGYSMSYSRFSRVGRELFQAFGVTQAVLVALISVILASDMISKEVRGKTLGLLMLTPLGRHRVVYGKLKSVMGYLLFFILAGFPILAVAIYMGGVAIESLAVISVLTLCTALMAASASMLISSFFRGVYVSFIVSAIALVLYSVLPLILVEAVSYRWRDEVWEVLIWTNPFYAVMSELLGPPRSSVDAGWIPAVVVSLILSGGLLQWVVLRLGRLAKVEPRRPVLKRVFDGMDRFFERINPWGVKVWAARRGVGAVNPVLWKELTFQSAGRLRYFTRLSLALIILMALVLLISGESFVDDEFYNPVIWIVTGLMFLIAVGAGAGSFSREKEEGKWDVLLSTPLQPASFVFGKLAGGATSLLPMVVVLGVASIPAVVMSVSMIPVLLYLWLMMLFILFMMVLASFFSLWLSTTRKAFALTLLTFVTLYAIVPFLVVLFALMTDMDLLDKDGVGTAFLLGTNPFGYVPLIDMATSDYQWYRSSFSDTQRAGAIGFSVVYLGATIGLIVLMQRRFDALTKRSP